MVQSLPVVVVYEIGILIIIASLSSEFFKRIRLPGLIGPVLVGLVIGGPGGLGLVTSLTVIEILGVLGAVLILFTVGLEFEASAFWKAGRGAFFLTTGGVALSLVLGYFAGRLLGWSHAAAFLLGVVMAPSGTSVVASILHSERRGDPRAGQTLLTALVVDDVEGVLLLSIALAVISERAFSVYESAKLVILAVVFILGSIYIGSRVFPSFISRFGRLLSDEVLFAIILGAGFVFAFAATQVGLAAITGAFLMGAVVPYSKIGEKVFHRLFFMKEIFAAIFFASIGLMMNPFDILRFFPVALLLCAAGIGARLMGGLIGGRIAGLGQKELWASTVGLAIRAEMSLIIAREGAATGAIGSDFLPVAATAVLLSIVLITPAFSRLVRSM